MKVTPYTAKRTIGLIAYHAGDLSAARHDIRIGLQSLGGAYTDRRSEAVLTVLDRMIALSDDDRRRQWLEKLTAIAENS